MRQSILRKTRYLLVAVMAFVLSFTAIFVSMPSAKAADEILLAQLTLSDVIANTSTPLGPSDKIQGTKGIFEWKGIKTVNTDSIVVHGNGDNFSYFWIGGDTGDYTMQVSKFVCTFTVSDKQAQQNFLVCLMDIMNLYMKVMN